jgi:glucose-6-phosphate dehydrogenase assembly protein OpcA
MEETMNRELNPESIENKINADLEKQPGHNIRACLFNLIFIYNIFREHIVSELLDFLFGKRPARIIHLQQTEKPVSSSYVKVRCYPDPQNNQVCFQEIIIQNGKDEIGNAPGTWVPLLIHEIPVIIVWLDSLQPFPSMLHTISTLADKVIFCTEANHLLGEDPLTVCRNIERQLIVRNENSTPGKPVVSDLTWFRSLPLRQQTALLFNPVSMRQYIYEIKDIALHGISQSEALLYLVWLASRLNWKPTEVKSGLPRFLDGRGNRVGIHMRDDTARKVVFITKDGQEFSINRIDEEGGECIINERHVLLDELDSLDHDPLYYDALNKIRENE